MQGTGGRSPERYSDRSARRRTGPVTQQPEKFQELIRRICTQNPQLFIVPYCVRHGASLGSGKRCGFLVFLRAFFQRAVLWKSACEPFVRWNRRVISCGNFYMERSWGQKPLELTSTNSFS